VKLLAVALAIALPALSVLTGPAAGDEPRPPVVVGTFEPGGGSTLAGNLATYISTAGRAPDVVNYFTDWDPKPFPSANLGVIAQTGATPLVTWQPQQFGRLGPTTADPAHSLAAIASGADDAYILDWARAAKAYGAPLYLRLAHEMNGSWYAWGRGVDGNTAEEYVAMWRHVHDLFDQVGATNVRWVWCPNVIYTSGSDPEPFYPGSAYVDVVGLDGYNLGGEASPPTWLSFSSIFDPTLDTLPSYAAGKPVWIVETGSSDVGGDKPAWLRDMFGTVASDTRISGLLYFDEKGTGDWPLSTSAAAGQAYADGWAGLRAAEAPAPMTPAASPSTAPTTPPSAHAAEPTLAASQLAAHTRRTRAVRLHGTATPGAKVVVQRRVGVRWRAVKTVGVPKSGTYAVRTSLPRKRVVLRARAGTSAYRRLTLRVR